MAAPDYVPRPKGEQVRVYESPPWRPEPWWADRPSDIAGDQPAGRGFGWHGPDQGYALRLVRQFEGDLVLAEGEHEPDVIAGCVNVALKRSSLFGRAPVIHDLAVAFDIWGFRSAAPEELVALRRPVFEGISHAHHHGDRHRVADLVPEASLRLTPEQVRQQAATDWRSLLDADAIEAVGADPR